MAYFGSLQGPTDCTSSDNTPYQSGALFVFQEIVYLLMVNIILDAESLNIKFLLNGDVSDGFVTMRKSLMRRARMVQMSRPGELML